MSSVHIHFVIPPTTELKKVKNAYSQRSGIAVDHLRFLFNGRPIQEDHTPETLKMEQEDIIEVEHRTEE